MVPGPGASISAYLSRSWVTVRDVSRVVTARMLAQSRQMQLSQSLPSREGLALGEFTCLRGISTAATDIAGIFIAWASVSAQVRRQSGPVYGFRKSEVSFRKQSLLYALTSYSANEAVSKCFI